MYLASLFSHNPLTIDYFILGCFLVRELFSIISKIPFIIYNIFIYV